MKNKIKNYLLYSGLTKEEYEKVFCNIREDNRKSVFAFSNISVLAFLVSALMQLRSKLGVGSGNMLLISLVFVLLAILSATIAKRYTILGDIFAYFFICFLLGIGIYAGVSQPTERTTLLLSFFLMSSILFCPRMLICMVINIIAEIIYLALIYNTQTGDVLVINASNSLIFAVAGLLATSYLLRIRHMKYLTECENKFLLERDALTSLYNRHSYNLELERIKSEKLSAAICACDINQLKTINDTYGHAAGDELIVGAAECIKSVVGDTGKVFRIGGDEFVAIVYREYDDPGQIIERIKLAGHSWKGKYINGVEISCGIAIVEDDFDEKLTETIKKADVLMYEDKRRFYETRNIDRRKR